MQSRPNINGTHDPIQHTITFIEAPSAYESTKTLKKALHKPPLFALFLDDDAAALPHDIDKRTIPQFGLICFDVGVYFDSLFSHDKNILYTGSNNTRQAIEHSCCILIFANEWEEINTIKAGIKEIIGHLPPILLATTLDLEVSNPDITSLISTKHLPPANPANFWEKVRESINTLLTSELTQTHENRL